MSHKQTDIRNALTSLLTGSSPAYATSAEDRVYKNKTHNLPSAKLPAIIIHDGNETAVPRDLRSNQYLRTWPVRIDIICEGISDVDVALDNLHKQIEDLIFANRSLGGLTTTILYTGSEPSFDGSGNKTIGIKTLNFNIQYTY